MRDPFHKSMWSPERFLVLSLPLAQKSLKNINPCLSNYGFLIIFRIYLSLLVDPGYSVPIQSSRKFFGCQNMTL